MTKVVRKIMIRNKSRQEVNAIGKWINTLIRWEGRVVHGTQHLAGSKAKKNKEANYGECARRVHGGMEGGRGLTFMGMFVMVVDAKSKCCWTRMLSLVARWRPARTLCTSLVSRGDTCDARWRRRGEEWQGSQGSHGPRSCCKGSGAFYYYCHSTEKNPPPSLAGQKRVCLLPVGKCGLGPGHTAG